MKFYANKGRPALRRPKKDLGTNELVNKRKNGLTKAPIDLLFAKSLINQAQYLGAENFKFLYNLRFGNLKLKAYNGFDPYGHSIYYSDEFLAKKSALYLKIAQYLNENKIFNIVANIVIFDIFPCILLKKPREVSKHFLNKAIFQQNELDGLRHGLDYINITCLKKEAI